MYSVTIRGHFNTGTTIDDQKEAEKKILDLLKEKLEMASCLRTNQVFSFTVDSIESERL